MKAIQLYTYYTPNASRSLTLGIFSVILLLPSIILFTSNATLAVLLIAIFIALVSFKTGIQINTTHNEIRAFTAYLWFKRGQWFAASEFDSYTIKHTKQTYRLNSRGSSYTSSDDNYTINIKGKHTLLAHAGKTDIVDINNKLTTIGIPIIQTAYNK